MTKEQYRAKAMQNVARAAQGLAHAARRVQKEQESAEAVDAYKAAQVFLQAAQTEAAAWWM